MIFFIIVTDAVQLYLDEVTFNTNCTISYVSYFKIQTRPYLQSDPVVSGLPLRPTYTVSTDFPQGFLSWISTHV